MLPGTAFDCFRASLVRFVITDRDQQVPVITTLSETYGDLVSNVTILCSAISLFLFLYLCLAITFHRSPKPVACWSSSS